MKRIIMGIVFVFLLISSNAFACKEALSVKFYKEALEFIRTCEESKFEFFKSNINLSEICEDTRSSDYYKKKYKDFNDCIGTFQNHVEHLQKIYLKGKMSSLIDQYRHHPPKTSHKLIDDFLIDSCPSTRDDLISNHKTMLSMAAKLCLPYTDAKFSHCEHSKFEFCKDILKFLKNPDDVSF
jgi:hypothetical protein